VWFSFTLLWFRAGWPQIHQIFGALTAWRWAAIGSATWITATIVLAGWEWLRAALLSCSTAEGPILLSRYARMAYAAALGCIAIITMFFLDQPAPAIVYKAF
jgi:hypothetical protein